MKYLALIAIVLCLNAYTASVSAIPSESGQIIATVTAAKDSALHVQNEPHLYRRGLNSTGPALIDPALAAAPVTPVKKEEKPVHTKDNPAITAPKDASSSKKPITESPAAEKPEIASAMNMANDSSDDQIYAGYDESAPIDAPPVETPASNLPKKPSFFKAALDKVGKGQSAKESAPNNSVADASSATVGSAVEQQINMVKSQLSQASAMLTDTQMKLAQEQSKSNQLQASLVGTQQSATQTIQQLQAQLKAVQTEVLTLKQSGGTAPNPMVPPSGAIYAQPALQQSQSPYQQPKGAQQQTRQGFQQPTQQMPPMMSAQQQQMLRQQQMRQFQAQQMAPQQHPTQAQPLAQQQMPYRPTGQAQQVRPSTQQLPAQAGQSQQVRPYVQQVPGQQGQMLQPHQTYPRYPSRAPSPSSTPAPATQPPK